MEKEKNYITKCDAYVHSLKNRDGSNTLVEVFIVDRLGDNEYVALYNGVRCTAIFNPFVGRFYVDDLYGRV